ncbi:MAG TPA: hypothetical protein PLI09_26110 [Candidatus Hydrogenedentes bacterium]|mgnify:CR=1 FL=1|nr:hypothetical protein [Candidatus Hydrogenedentota bacterium]
MDAISAVFGILFDVIAVCCAAMGFANLGNGAIYYLPITAVFGAAGGVLTWLGFT